MACTPATCWESPTCRPATTPATTACRTGLTGIHLTGPSRTQTARPGHGQGRQNGRRGARTVFSGTIATAWLPPAWQQRKAAGGHHDGHSGQMNTPDRSYGAVGRGDGVKFALAVARSNLDVVAGSTSRPAGVRGRRQRTLIASYIMSPATPGPRTVMTGRADLAGTPEIGAGAVRGWRVGPAPASRTMRNTASWTPESCWLSRSSPTTTLTRRLVDRPAKPRPDRRIFANHGEPEGLSVADLRHAGPPLFRRRVGASGPADAPASAVDPG
jgi:hypothetical protein